MQMLYIIEQTNKYHTFFSLEIISCIRPTTSLCFCEIKFQVSKRDITLLDRSEKSVRATLWGDDVSKTQLST